MARAAPSPAAASSVGFSVLCSGKVLRKARWAHAIPCSCCPAWEGKFPPQWSYHRGAQWYLAALVEGTDPVPYRCATSVHHHDHEGISPDMVPEQISQAHVTQPIGEWKARALLPLWKYLRNIVRTNRYQRTDIMLSTQTALENVTPSKALRIPVSSTAEIQLLAKYCDTSKL